MKFDASRIRPQVWPPRWERYRRMLRFAAPVLCCAVFVYLTTVSGYQITVVGNGMLVGMAAVGVGYLLKTLRLVSLGQGALVGLGAYVEVAIGYNRANGFLLGFLSALGMALVVGGIIGLAASRLRSHYYILLTIAMQAIGTACILGFVSLTGGAEGQPVIGSIDLFGMNIVSLKGMAILIGVFALVTTALAEWASGNRLGQRMFAVATSTPMARASGISPMRANVIGNCVAAGLGAIAGALWAPFTGYVGPDDFALSLSVLALMAGSLAIRSTLWVSLLAAILLTEFTQGISTLGNATGVVYGVLVVVISAGLAVASQREQSLNRARGSGSRRFMFKWRAQTPVVDETEATP